MTARTGYIPPTQAAPAYRQAGKSLPRARWCGGCHYASIKLIMTDRINPYNPIQPKMPLFAPFVAVGAQALKNMVIHI